MRSDSFFVRQGTHLLARELEWREVHLGDEEYPIHLAELKDAPPKKIWVAGRTLTELPVCVAIVGTRKANSYGLEVSLNLAADLAQQGVCIVSGMALGIDAEAHRGALSVGGLTVAVLGSGVDVCQPATNADLYQAIAERGTIVSEQKPGTPGFADNFVPRNRIIAGLSAAVVVVQAARERAGKMTGAMTTAKFAERSDREVFAVPGQVGWTISTGVHDLIRSGAALCTGAGDVAQSLGSRLHWTPEVEHRPIPTNLPDNARLILSKLSDGALTAESICAVTGLGPAAVGAALGELESAGLVAPAPGGRIRRVR